MAACSTISSLTSRVLPGLHMGCVWEPLKHTTQPLLTAGEIKARAARTLKGDPGICTQQQGQDLPSAFGTSNDFLPWVVVPAAAARLSLLVSRSRLLRAPLEERTALPLPLESEDTSSLLLLASFASSSCSRWLTWCSSTDGVRQAC